jgi:hypothetical protein
LLLLLLPSAPDGEEATEADDDSDVPGRLVDRDGEGETTSSTADDDRNEIMDDDDGELRDEGGDGKLNASEDDANDTTIQTTNFDDTFMVWLIFFGRGGMDVVVPLPQTSERGGGGGRWLDAGR